MLNKVVIPLFVTLLCASIIAAASAVISVKVMEAQQLTFEQKLNQFGQKQDRMSELLVETLTDVRWIKEKISK